MGQSGDGHTEDVEALNVYFFRSGGICPHILKHERMRTGRLIYNSGDGLIIYDRLDSHLHLEPYILTRALMDCGLRVYDMDGGDIIKIVLPDAFDEPQPCYLVEADMDCDRVYYERRGNRKGFSRMIRAQPTTSNNLVIILKKSGSHYIIITAYAGDISPKEPWDTSISTPEEYEQSLRFWTTHALVPH